MRKLLVPSAFLALAAGCTSVPPTQHAAANQEWQTARSSVLYSLASDQYQNGQFDKCQESLDQAIGMSPDDASLHLLAAKVAIEQGRLEAAMAHADRARAIEPKSADAEYFTGVIWQRWANPAKAEAAYAAAVAKNPGELSFVLAQAEMLVAMNKPADALSLLELKEVQFDHSAAIRDEIGQLLIQQKQYPAAVMELRIAAQLSTDDLAIHEHLAFAFLLNKNFATAIEAFDRLVKTDAGAKRADLWAALAESQSNLEHLRDARASLETAVNLDAKSPGYLLELARVCLGLNDLPRADAAVRRAVGLSPESAEAQCLLGYVRVKQGMWPEALTAFRAASAADPADTVSICMTGYVLGKMNRPAESKEAFTAALKIKPDDELAKRLMTSVDRHD